MSSTGIPSKRPCLLPTVQIDTWEHKVDERTCTLDALARALLCDRQHLVCHALLKTIPARTIVDFASCIDSIHSPIEPYVHGGQIYMQRNWRVRFRDMDDTLQQMLLNIEVHSNEHIKDAFIRYYDADALEHLTYRIIGPARTAGTLCYRRWQSARDTSTRHAAPRSADQSYKQSPDRCSSPDDSHQRTCR